VLRRRQITPLHVGPAAEALCALPWPGDVHVCGPFFHLLLQQLQPGSGSGVYVSLLIVGIEAACSAIHKYPRECCVSFMQGVTFQDGNIRQHMFLVVAAALGVIDSTYARSALFHAKNANPDAVPVATVKTLILRRK
jgi:hypothetical protein